MTIEYELDTKQVNEHIIKVEMSFSAPWDNPILELPVWTPGSYKVRDYSKNIFRFKPSSSSVQLEWDKISKNQWQLQVEKGTSVNVTYSVYAYNLTVRTSYLDDRYGLISPASVFFYLIDGNGNDSKGSQYKVKLHIQNEWNVFTSLDSDNEWYISKDYDELVDSPFGLAHPDVLETSNYSIEDTDGSSIPCRIALIGHKGNQDIKQFEEQMIKLQEKSIEMFGSLPYDHYLWVLYVVGSGGGGLEHKFSNFSIINRWYFTGDDLKYAKLMSLEAHEHFHAYNIKRIRPTQLGPFNYSDEVYTTLLWVAEGVTSFYDNIFLPRTGIIEESTYWKVIAKDYTQLQKIHGRFETSLSESSFDAWIKLYQSHEGSHNLFVSYYLKGGLVAFMLDLEIREQTGWKYSLDDFFKTMYELFLENGQTYDEDNLRNLIEDATETDLNEFWKKYIDGLEELPFNDYLQHIGMELKPDNDSDVPYTGLILKSSSTKVSQVRYNSPAMEAGIYSGDKIIALNGFEVTSSNMDTILKNQSLESKVSVHLIRDGVLREVSLKLMEPEPTKYKIVEISNPSDIQKSRRQIFLHRL